METRFEALVEKYQKAPATNTSLQISDWVALEIAVPGNFRRADSHSCQVDGELSQRKMPCNQAISEFSFQKELHSDERTSILSRVDAPKATVGKSNFSQATRSELPRVRFETEAADAASLDTAAYELRKR